MFKQLNFIFFFLVFLIISCTNDGEKVEEVKTEKQEPFGEIVTREAKKVDAYFKARHKKNLFNGTVLYAKNGKVIYNKAFGYANTVKKKKLNTCSSFQLASVSKPITAIAVLKLKEQGKLNYDDDVKKYFPEFPFDGITVKLLLTHRSGLANYMYFADELWKDKEAPIKNKDVIDLMIKHKPAPYYKPDHKYNYSNTGYCILAAIVEKITEKPFEDFVQTEIFEPTGMHESFIYRKGNGQLEKCDVKGYNANNTEADNSYQNGVVGDKGVYSSAEDLFRLDQALYGGKLLSDETLKEAFTGLHKDLKAYDNYGLGWRIRDIDADKKIVFHCGWWKGFRTYFIRDITEKKTIIVLNNSNKGGFMKVDELRELF